MITSKFSGDPFSHVSDAYDLNSVYRPLKWKPGYVLSERRKKVLRKKQLSRVIWVMTISIFVLMIAMISQVTSQVREPGDLMKMQPVNFQQGNEVQPINRPVIEYMTDEEWQKMRQEAYEWLGC